MTDTVSPVVVSYSEFLERRERRRRIAAELQQRVASETIDVPSAAESPLPGGRPDQRHEK